MRFSAVFFTLGLFLLVLAALALLPALMALVQGEFALGIEFIGMALLAAFVGGGFVIALGGPRRRSGVREAVLLLLLAWTVLPAFAMIPAFLSGWPGNLAQAYFEAVSALTTTGATQYHEASGAPDAIILWRSLLHWVGGLGGLLAAAAVLTGVTPTALPVQGVIVPNLERDALVARLLPIGMVLAPAYGILTLAIVILLLLTGLAPFDAVCLGLSAIATGGTSAHGPVVSLFGFAPVEFVVALAMVAGAVSFATHTTALGGNIRAYLRDPEAVAFFSVILGAIGLTWLLGGAALWPQAFQIVSLVTTSGYVHEGAVGVLPPALIFTLALLGGSVISTAGGIKMMRLVILWRQSRREVQMLAHPNSVSRARVQGRSLTSEMAEPVWIYFVALATAITFLALFLSLSMPNFTVAAGASVAMLANTGPSLHLAFPDAPGYGEFGAGALLAMSFGMILGRIEILALPILLTGSFWRY